MKVRSLFFGATALAAIALAPGQASAQVGASGNCGVLGYTATLGLGGSLVGCFNFSIRELGEDAGSVSAQTLWTTGSFLAPTGITNSTTGGQAIYTDDCGSNGSPGQYAFCPVNAAETVTGFNALGELVFGLDVPDHTYNPGGYWQYSGAESRNSVPAPTGYQQVLLAVTDVPGEYLFAWEDLNSGCQGPLTGGDTGILSSQLSSGAFLEMNLAGDCSAAILPGGDSDSDFNDSMLLLNIAGTPLASVTPEPMTMTLMAIGLIGLGGTSLRRRKKK
jgi:hypothetical protein